MRTPRWRLVLLVGLVALGLAVVPVRADDGRTLAIVGQDYTLQEGERLEDDLLVLGGLTRLLEGSVVEGNVVTVGGETTIAGSVRGDVVAIGGSVDLASTALIEGDLVVFGRARRHPEATVRGNTIEGLEATKRFSHVPRMCNGGVPQLRPSRPAKPEQAARSSETVRLVATAAVILFLTALVVALLPEHLTRVSEAMTQVWLLCCGMGILTILVVLILIPVLVIICLGIPVAIVLAIGLLVSILIGLAAAGNLLGERLLKALGAGGQPPLLTTLAGTLVIALVAIIPYLGPALAAILGAWGVGAVVLTRFGSVPYGMWASPPKPAPPVPDAASSPTGPSATSDRPAHARDTRRLDRSAPPESGAHRESPPQR